MRAGGDIPLSDTFAVRLDGSIRARDGFMTDFNTGDDFNTQNRYSLRGQALWDISDNATLRVIADYAETDEDCCAATVLQYGATQAILTDAYLIGNPYAPFLPSFNGTSLPNTAAVVNSPDAREVLVTPGRDYLEQVEDGGISGQLDWEFGNGVTLTSITAQRSWSAIRGQDIDFNDVDLFYRDGLTVDIDNFTQEFRLQGEWGRVNWLVGAFYSQEDLATTDRIRYGAQASDYADAVVFGNTVGTRELFDNTSAGVDAFFFGGVDPVPSLVGAINAAFDQTYLAPISDGDGQQADSWTQDATDIAVFTHNEISLSDALTLTVGVRYSQSEKEYEGVLDAENPNCDSMQALETGFGLFSGLNAAANLGSVPAQGLRTLFSIACAPQSNTALNSTAAAPWTSDRSEDAWSGTASLRYEMSDNLMFYGGYSRGYKAGGFNLDRSSFLGIFPGMTPTQAAALIDPASIGFEPEYVDSYEAGMRSTILDGTTFFNVTLFYAQLHDYQLNAFNGTAFITRNIPEAVSQGVEIDVLARLTENLTIQAGANYTDAFNDSTVAFSAAAADTIFADTPLVQAPEWSFTAAVTYELPLTEDFGARFYVDARYDSDYVTQALGRNPISDMPETVVVNGRVSLGNPDGHWSVELWGRNLTDEFIQGGFNLPLQSGSVGSFTNEPQTYGVTVRARY
jgi:iron complex outermembrane recepter protein